MKKAYLKILSSFVLLSLIIAFAALFSSCGVGSEVILSAEQLSANAAAEADTDEEYAYIYFDRWDFPSFSGGKFKRVENIYRKYYYKELPTPYEAASATSEIFIKKYYSNIDLSNSEAVTDALISSYVLSIGDPYSFYRTKEEYQSYSGNMSGTFVGIGVSVTKLADSEEILVTSPIKDSPAEKAGILAEDIIVAVDGVRASDVGYQKAIDMIKGEKGTTVTITVRRGSEEKSFTVKREPIVESSVTYQLSEDKIGYIDIDSFKSNTDELFAEAIDYMKENGARVIIYDVRDNSGGYLDTVVNMLDYIARDGTTLASFSDDYQKPYTADDGHEFSVSTIILCNGSSASAAELFTAGIRDIGTIDGFSVSTVGQKTFGKGIMQSSFRFSDKSAITLTVAYYYSPLGENFDGEGIAPTNPVEGAANQRKAAYELAAAIIADLN